MSRRSAAKTRTRSSTSPELCSKSTGTAPSGSRPWPRRRAFPARRSTCTSTRRPTRPGPARARERARRRTRDARRCGSRPTRAPRSIPSAPHPLERFPRSSPLPTPSSHPSTSARDPGRLGGSAAGPLRRLPSLGPMARARWRPRAGITVRDAADVLSAMVSIRSYESLVIERGWTPQRWTRWQLEVAPAPARRNRTVATHWHGGGHRDQGHSRQRPTRDRSLKTRDAT